MPQQNGLVIRKFEQRIYLQFEGNTGTELAITGIPGRTLSDNQHHTGNMATF